MSKRNISPEVRAFFAEIGRQNGKKLFKERGSEYFRNLAAKRKTHGRQKPKEEAVEQSEKHEQNPDQTT